MTRKMLHCGIPLVLTLSLGLAGCDFLLEDEEDNNEENSGPLNGVANNTTFEPPLNNTIVEPPLNNTIVEPPLNNTTIEPPPPPTGEWAEVALPCDTRTDVLYFDDDTTGFMGCGEGTRGTGLFMTMDGGASWGSVLEFEEVRVSGITRGPDNLLYVSGKHTGKSFITWQLDTSGEIIEGNVILRYSGSAPFMRIGHAEEIAITEDGQIMTESLTGSYLAYSPTGAAEDFQEIEYWDDRTLDGMNTASTINAMVAWENNFYAVGGRINDPPAVFLPSRKDYDEGYYFERVDIIPEINEESGEVRDLHVFGDNEMVAVGFNQTERTPILARSSDDWYDAGSWSVLSKAALAQAEIPNCDIRDIDVQGDTIVAVGERVPTSEGGIILRSDDRGATWTNISGPTELPVLWRVKLYSDGRILAAGGATGVKNF